MISAYKQAAVCEVNKTQSSLNKIDVFHSLFRIFLGVTHQKTVKLHDLSGPIV